jgi:hypothetical protein
VYGAAVVLVLVQLKVKVLAVALEAARPVTAVGTPIGVVVATEERPPSVASLYAATLKE